MTPCCAADARSKADWRSVSMAASAVSVLPSKHCSMATVLSWLPQSAGALVTRAGWPGSNGSMIAAKVPPPAAAPCWPVAPVARAALAVTVAPGGVLPLPAGAPAPPAAGQQAAAATDRAAVASPPRTCPGLVPEHQTPPVHFAHDYLPCFRPALDRSRFTWFALRSQGRQRRLSRRSSQTVHAGTAWLSGEPLRRKTPMGTSWLASGSNDGGFGAVTGNRSCPADHGRRPLRRPVGVLHGRRPASRMTGRTEGK